MGKRFSDYQKASGLNCLKGCGKCCTFSEVEASAFEMIPLALKLYDENKLEEWLNKLENSQQQSCMMYRPTSPDGASGTCASYDERPSVCRMFGVAGFYNKHKDVTLSVCKLIREKYPELTKMRESEASEEKTPMLMSWSYRLANLDPRLTQDRMPINQAIKAALEKVSLYALYQEGQ